MQKRLNYCLHFIPWSKTAKQTNKIGKFQSNQTRGKNEICSCDARILGAIAWSICKIETKQIEAKKKLNRNSYHLDD